MLSYRRKSDVVGHVGPMRHSVLVTRPKLQKKVATPAFKKPRKIAKRLLERRSTLADLREEQAAMLKTMKRRVPKPSGTVGMVKKLAKLIAKCNELRPYRSSQLGRLASNDCQQLLAGYDFDKELLEKHVFWLVLRWVTDVDVLFELFLDANAKNVQLENIDDFDIRDIITKQSPKLLRLALTMELSKDFLEEEANCIAIAAAETGNPQLFEVAWKTLCEIYPENESMEAPRYLGEATELELLCLQAAIDEKHRDLLQHMVNEMGFVDEGWFEMLSKNNDEQALFFQSCFPVKQ